MPGHMASLDTLVHPHQMEVQEFGSYALVIDARSPEAYRDDHLPGAVSVPVDAAPALAEATSASAVEAREPSPRWSSALGEHLHRLAPGDTVLVYCDRGGLDSLVWATPLKTLGYRVDVLGGGWVNYRRWVAAGLDVLPRALRFRRLVAPPVGGLCRVLDALRQRGEQVLDLWDLAGQKLVPGLTLDGDPTPSQSPFDSAVLHALRRFNPQQLVWVRDGLPDSGMLSVPAALRDALRRSDALQLAVPLEVRAQAWFERLRGMGASQDALIDALVASASPPAVAMLGRCRAMVEAGQTVQALSEVIQAHVDLQFQLDTTASAAQIVQLSSLNADTVAATVDAWLKSEGPAPIPRSAAAPDQSRP